MFSRPEEFSPQTTRFLKYCGLIRSRLSITHSNLMRIPVDKILPLAGCIMLACVSVQAQPSDIRQGLVAYWPLDSTDGTVTPDLSPFGNSLNLIGMTSANFVPGVRGNAASFNGTSQLLSKIYTAGTDNGLPIYNARRYTIML